MGVGKNANMVYLIDFGLSKEFRDPNTRAHIPYRKDIGMTGTATFASVNSHMGLELGRRDDLESLAYVLIYLLCGFLPWHGSKNILERKRRITMHPLVEKVPIEFRTFLEHCRSLGFDDKPDYTTLRSLFSNLLLQKGFQRDAAFDWDVDVQVPKLVNPTQVAQHERSFSPKQAGRP
jgi:serine/threonine protein kinase